MALNAEYLLIIFSFVLIFYFFKTNLVKQILIRKPGPIFLLNPL